MAPQRIAIRRTTGVAISDNAALKSRIRMYLNTAPFVHNVFQSFRLLHAACCGSVHRRYFLGPKSNYSLCHWVITRYGEGLDTWLASDRSRGLCRQVTGQSGSPPHAHGLYKRVRKKSRSIDKIAPPELARFRR